MKKIINALTIIILSIGMSFCFNGLLTVLNIIVDIPINLFTIFVTGAISVFVTFKLTECLEL